MSIERIMGKDIKKVNYELGSLLQDTKQCFVCLNTNNLHKHHIFYGTANRKLSDEDLMCVYLCAPHHNLSNQGVHFNRELDTRLKKHAEKIWLEYYTDKTSDLDSRIKLFIDRYGKNYLDEEDF